MVNIIGNQGEGNSSEDSEEPSAKRRKMNKTPVAILTELCTQKRVSQPIFTEVDINSLSQEFRSLNFKFYMKCTAFSKTSLGGGVLKKAAKHNAAENLLKKISKNIEGNEDDDDLLASAMNNHDYITELLNLCVQNNFHKPEFVLTESYGPTHLPTFTFECRLDSLVRKGSSTTKQIAKKIAARNVLDILKLSYPDQEKKVMLINDQNMAKEEASRKITSYLELKCRDKVDKMGTLVCNRHNFFVDYKNEDFINSLKDILLRNIELKAKYEAFTNELKNEWDFNVRNFADLNLIMFELLIDFDQFTVNLVCKENDLEKTVISYFMNMLHLVPLSEFIPSNAFANDRVILYPL